LVLHLAAVPTFRKWQKEVMRGPTASDLTLSHPTSPTLTRNLTRNGMGNCYSCLIAPETFETFPTGILLMSPAFERESPH
jgi:hypothetical protein